MSYSIQFIGVGGAFATPEQYQSNLLITAESGKKLLIDCGSQAQHALLELGINNGNVGSEIDGVFVTHLHSDHVGSLEWLAFCTYFNPSCKRPKMYGISSVITDLWNKSLRGGLESIQSKKVTLTDYFDVRYVSKNSFFEWEGIIFEPIQVVHVVSCHSIVNSYGLMIKEKNSNYKVFFTSDTQFAPHQMVDFYKESNLIFHDCETAKIKSGVHAHYESLKTLDKTEKEKMWLYHYSPDHNYNEIEDGFAGFAQKFQTFMINSES
jgi:ribonuclease BN (tRNA processing enzyme)